MFVQREINSRLAKYRVGVAFLVFLSLLALGGGASWLIGLRLQHEHALDKAKQGVRQIEQVFSRAEQIIDQAAELVSLPCQAVLPKLRKLATRAEFVRTLYLVQDSSIYCSSLSGSVKEPLRSDDFFAERFSLRKGSALRPDHPFLSMLTPVAKGAVISYIDSTHLKTALSSSLPTGEGAWLRVGEEWLDEVGRYHQNAPLFNTSHTVEQRSSIYPIVVTISYSVNVTDIFLHWVKVWRFTWLSWLALSLFVSITVWKRLGHISPVEVALQEGLKRHEFIPYVQPILSAHSRKICGLEVWMRWQRQGVGVIEPMQFISQAESSGLIVPMTSQIMTQVAKLLAPMASRLPMPFHVAFNISAAHLRSNSFLSDCRVFLGSFPSGRVMLTLELTERELLCNDNHVQFVINQLRKLGIQLVLGGFGSGHSSLAYLKQFPVDIIKLDQMVVRKIGQEAISQHLVNHVIDLGRKLGLEIVAEGVENEYQANYLIQMGADRLYGDLFGRPQPLREWIDTIELGMSYGGIRQSLLPTLIS